DRRNFMVIANLASAHQLAGRLDRAVSYLLQVKDVWPADWPGFSKNKLDWYRRVEQYHLQLARLRYRESLRQGKGQAAAGLDDLFGSASGPVLFLAESGR